MAGLVEQCLGLTELDARHQWRRIAGRSWQKRQETFLPVELGLCLGLFRRLNPHSFGGANLHRLPPEVGTLAQAFKRPPGSLTNKMLNLEGFRANGARDETELFLRLGQDVALFVRLYALVVGAARQEGFGEQAVPDFLGWLEAAPEPLLGQEEITSSELDVVLGENAEELRALEQVYGFDERETTRIVEQRVRLGQHRFASQVLTTYRHRCAFCGLDASSLRGHRLMFASHIKPWAACTNRERLDPSNGVSACSIHDSAFDTGLLTVRRDLTIERSTVLDGLMETDAAVERFFGEGAIGRRLSVPAGANGPGARFLDFHVREVFRG